MSRNFALPPPLCGSFHRDQRAGAHSHRLGREPLALQFVKHVVADAVRGAKFANAVAGPLDRFFPAKIADDSGNSGFERCQPLQDFCKR